MEIKDLYLKGGVWKTVLQALEPFFPLKLQPNYSIFVISTAIGIMYDKRQEKAGEETQAEKDSRSTVPRTVLHPHNEDLDFLFQAAILATKTVEISESERMKMAFDSDYECNFDKLSFLASFANFGVVKLAEKIDKEPVLIMENIKDFLTSTFEGYNNEIGSISEEELTIEDLEEFIE